MVTTCSTPGSFLAALVSIDLIWPCATVLRNIFGMQHARQPHGVGVFGAAGDLVAAFEARHRAADLRADLGGAGIAGRGHQCAPSSVQGRANGAPHIDPHQFALVGHRAAHVGDELAFPDRRVAGLREQLVVDGLAVEHALPRP